MTSTLTPPTTPSASGMQGNQLPAGFNPQAQQPQASSLKPLLAEYIKGNEKEFLAYMEAQARADLERAKPDNDRAIAKMEKQETKALAALTTALEITPMSGKKVEQIKEERAAVLNALKENTPDAREITLDVIKLELAKEATGFFSHSATSLVKEIRVAQAQGETGAKKVIKLTEKLRHKIDRDDLTDHLSATDKEAIVTALISNADAVLAKNQETNPVGTAVHNSVGGAVNGVVNEITNPASYLPPGARSALAVAQGVMKGGK